MSQHRSPPPGWPELPVHGAGVYRAAAAVPSDRVSAAPPTPRTPKVEWEGDRVLTAARIRREAGWLARSLASDQWPGWAVRHPRLLGLGLIVSGVLGGYELSRIIEDGGIYARALPMLVTLGLVTGPWLAVFGRPANEHGYTPHWWNVGYVATVVVAFIAALVLDAAWL